MKSSPFCRPELRALASYNCHPWAEGRPWAFEELLHFPGVHIHLLLLAHKPFAFVASAVASSSFVVGTPFAFEPFG